MSVTSRISSIFAIGILCGLAHPATAQKWTPFAPVNYTHDFEPFETFDIRNMSARPDPHEGFFFTFDKISWAVSGEHTTLGNPNVVANVPVLVRGMPTPPPQVINGIQDTSPDSNFGWGERYEFGHIVDHHGWMVTVLDGPEVNDIESYGHPDEIFFDIENDGIVFHTEHPGAGNVVILFDMPPGLMDGFVFDSTDTPIDFDGDGLIDIDDLITYMTTFDEVTVRNRTEIDGVELMKSYRFKPTQKGSVIEFAYGVRYLRFRDNFRVDARGGILNDYDFDAGVADHDTRTSFWDTNIDNHIVGPQIAMRWARQTGRWNFNATGRFTFGYNNQDQDQVGQMGTTLDFLTPGSPTDPVNPFPNSVPGARNQPIYFFNTAFRHGKQEQEFSPLVELRTEASYYLTQQFALKLGFNATFIDNVRRASQQVNYSLPNMGFINGGTQEVFVSGVNIGFEFNR